jgi:hypothetical protein
MMGKNAASVLPPAVGAQMTRCFSVYGLVTVV